MNTNPLFGQSWKVQISMMPKIIEGVGVNFFFFGGGVKGMGIWAEVYTFILNAMKQTAFSGRIIPLFPHHI